MASKRTLRSATRLSGTSVPDLTAVLTSHRSPEGKTIASSQSTAVGQSIEDTATDLLSEPPKKKVKPNLRASTPTKRSTSLPSFDRPAGPHTTNAPLSTPQGSRLVTYTQEVLDSSPSKTGIPRPTTSTSQLLDQACAHLVQADPRLEPLIAKHHCRLFSAEGLAEVIDPFQSLCSSIMAQQVSGAAATSIKNKFIGLFHDSAEKSVSIEKPPFPSPAKVASSEVAFLRKAGLSARKAEYIKGLAEKFVNGELTTAMLINASDEEIVEKLTAVRGLGLWSVQMFACFALKRTDIFSTGTNVHHSSDINGFRLTTQLKAI
ncbi:MAG: hypothetical protein L6R40_002659 [Gallowayella cf. fulva]|nr:MAG: hypothetical protein L6R40_002659 [Xanthomendoza cf. fulva]